MSDEIEITPEMIEAGASVVRQFDARYEDEESVAEEVFRAMLIAAAAQRTRSTSVGGGNQVRT